MASSPPGLSKWLGGETAKFPSYKFPSLTVNLAKFPVGDDVAAAAAADDDDDDDDLTWQSSQVEDFIRLRALLALEGTFSKEGSFTKVMVQPGCGCSGILD